MTPGYAVSCICVTGNVFPITGERLLGQFTNLWGELSMRFDIASGGRLDLPGVWSLCRVDTPEPVWSHTRPDLALKIRDGLPGMPAGASRAFGDTTDFPGIIRRVLPSRHQTLYDVVFAPFV